MTRQWVNLLIRCSVYLCFAAGMALLVSDGGGLTDLSRKLPFA